MGHSLMVLTPIFSVTFGGWGLAPKGRHPLLFVVSTVATRDPSARAAPRDLSQFGLAAQNSPDMAFASVPSD